MTDARPDSRGKNLGHKVDDAAIAPKGARHHRAHIFQIYVFLAMAAFSALAVAAHFTPYFPVDLAITHLVQSEHSHVLETLMRGLSWMGWNPQASLIVIGGVTFLLLIGLRWEAVVAVIAALSTAMGALIKVLVIRPRPSAGLVHVFSALSTTSFPSGHVLLATSFYGFLAFLMYSLLKQSWYRVLGLCIMALIIILMGPSRIYLGQHWFSDVMGAYVLGSVWLALSIRIYRWGKPRFFQDQPTAREPVEA